MMQFIKISKKMICSISLVYGLSFAQITSAQIVLEHTFNESVSFNIGVVNGETNILQDAVTYPENSYYFTEIVENSYHIKVYNSDYSINTDQSYEFTPPIGYEVSSVSPSKKLFNADDNYEFMVTLMKTSYVSNDNEFFKTILYDINGNVMKDFGTGNSIVMSPYLFIINNHYKLMVQKTLYSIENGRETHTEIYNIPGTHSSTNISEVRTSKNQSPYPNPANSTITLPYQLKQGEMSVMQIFNINGQLVETKRIDFVFDRILLNVSNYTKGVYIYEVNGVSSRFIVD